MLSRLFAAEVMKEGGHLPHYFLSREGVRIDSSDKLVEAVEEFIIRKEDRQVAALEGLMPTLVKLATSSHLPSRVKGLTQLWEASQRPLHHTTIITLGLGSVYEGLLSGIRVRPGRGCVSPVSTESGMPRSVFVHRCVGVHL